MHSLHLKRKNNAVPPKGPSLVLHSKRGGRLASPFYFGFYVIVLGVMWTPKLSFCDVSKGLGVKGFRRLFAYSNKQYLIVVVVRFN